MALPSGAHASIGGLEYLIDEDYESKVGRRGYRHFGRSLFAGRTDISGKPGAQNLQPDNLVWQITDFSGEGQVVFDESRPGRFYSSEGLDMRIPGQFSLNKSSVAQIPTASGSAGGTSKEGAADFNDDIGVSTSSGTDRIINTVDDKVKTSVVYTPGAKAVQTDFYLYRQVFSDYASTIQGSSMLNAGGGGEPIVADGTFVLKKVGDVCRTTKLQTGDEVVLHQTTRAEIFLHNNSGSNQAKVQIVETTNADNIIASKSVTVTDTATPTVATVHLDWNPLQDKAYEVRVTLSGNLGGRMQVDSVKYGAEITDNVATIEVYNSTGAAIVSTRDVSITSTAAGTLVGSLNYTAAAATDYVFKVTRQSGEQKIVVDKVVLGVQSTGTWTLDATEVGFGGNILLVGHVGGSDSNIWSFDTAANTWTTSPTAITGSSGATCYAMAHSDAYEYLLMSDGKVYYTDLSGVHTAYTATMASILSSSVGVGMCIAQDRVMVLCEDSTNGVYVRIFAVDGAPTVAETSHVQIATAHNTADTSFRHRMCGTPTGGRFFVNYSDVTSKIYEVDTSGSTPIYKELADLGTGVKATAIAYEGGITFITVQYAAETDQTPQSALFILDTNGVLQRIGFFRYYDPTQAFPISISSYQTNLWILQGHHVWRYSLSQGGLFCEYELDPADPTTAKGMSVMQGRTVAVYAAEAWVTGTVSVYRQAGMENANTFTSAAYDFALPGFKKVLQDIRILTDTMPDDTQVAIEYQIDQNATWTRIGTATEGTINRFVASDADNPILFNTIQVRAITSSLTGVATPTVKAITVSALPAEAEEFFELALLCEDQDSSFHIANAQDPGSDLAGLLYGLWQTHTPTTFLDGYADKKLGVAPSYLVRVDNFDDQRTAQGEGRVVVTLRVLQ